MSLACKLKNMRTKVKLIRDATLGLLSYLFRIFPLQNKVVGIAVAGRRYADNPKYVMEELLHRKTAAKLCWIQSPNCEMIVPKKIRLVNKLNLLGYIYCYATAKVLITTTGFPMFIRKRKGQIVINTWHGGLGIKKIGYDNNKEIRHDEKLFYMLFNNKLADVFISNSNHLSQLYRESFKYQGPIWKCGYPKNDALLSKSKRAEAAERIRKQLKIPPSMRILIYAPTYRAKDTGIGVDTTMSYYDIDYARLYESLKRRFGGEWCILQKFHPNMQGSVLGNVEEESYYKDVTSYHNMQDLIMASDALISDYSSCMFDAALAGLHTFIYANDFDEYKRNRGVYYELEDLPFPYASNNDELVANIENYDCKIAKSKWDSFCTRTGLVETGHAAKDIAAKILEHLNGKPVIWENTDI